MRRNVAQKTASRIVLIYIFSSIIWIVISDYLMKNYFFFRSEWIDITKGCVFILISGLIFYQLIQKGVKATLKSEAKYRLIVENVSDLISIINLNGKFEYISPSHQTIFGFTQEELIGKSVFEYVKEEEISKLKESLQNVKTQKKEFQLNLI
ncbi:PAS domain S-box protein [Metabacillus sp. B2-18]|uniref:PAS domain S-box protein n=1 Tax=Metabacillus sp. B2-18 TaxID=2897333 RepID=UPI001E6389B1|nr:PAS domain S-box protein [Metabacillus sp. B2-18]UGB28773.1 PAS domain S-box protein [Metabacillus sp. B2-18]